MGQWVDIGWLDIILKIGAVTITVSFLYAIVGYLFTKKAIFQTVLGPSDDEKDIMSYYFLPLPKIRLSVTATVDLSLDSVTQEVKNSVLKRLNVVGTVELVPDTRRILFVKYFGSSFANDDVKITTNSSGLLDNVSLVAEDRIANIFSLLSSSPREILQESKVQDLSQASNAVESIVTREYIKDFSLDPDKIMPNTTVSINWLIEDVDDTNKKFNVDSSFKIEFTPLFPLSPIDELKPLKYTGNGILVRPPITLMVRLTPEERNVFIPIGSNISSIIVPDISKTVLISLTRSLMVKRTQTLKLQNGVLLENSIVKPSESETLVSIPIEILKSIISIPAQLLSFQIKHIQQRKKIVDEDAAFDKAILDKKKASIGSEAELTTAKLNAIKITEFYEQELYKTKMEVQKNLIDSEKNLLEAKKGILQAQKDINELQEALEKMKGTRNL